MNSQIVFETLAYRIGLVTFSIFNSVLVIFLFKKRSRRLAAALRWFVVVFMIVGIIGLAFNVLFYLSPFSKQVADVFFAQALFFGALNYVARPLYSLDSHSQSSGGGR